MLPSPVIYISLVCILLWISISLFFTLPTATNLHHQCFVTKLKTAVKKKKKQKQERKKELRYCH